MVISASFERDLGGCLLRLISHNLDHRRLRRLHLRMTHSSSAGPSIQVQIRNLHGISTWLSRPRVTTGRCRAVPPESLRTKTCRGGLPYQEGVRRLPYQEGVRWLPYLEGATCAPDVAQIRFIVDPARPITAPTPQLATISSTPTGRWSKDSGGPPLPPVAAPGPPATTPGPPIATPGPPVVAGRAS